MAEWSSSQLVESSIRIFPGPEQTTQDFVKSLIGFFEIHKNLCVFGSLREDPQKTITPFNESTI